uniref:Uncharacterized protein n=1 Tax=Arundo donax TaxID=35708 RepID=A0A0A9A2Z5_ARUDO
MFLAKRWLVRWYGTCCLVANIHSSSLFKHKSVGFIWNFQYFIP